MKAETFGSCLKSLRLGRNLGLREFARLVGMDVGNLSRIERSIAPPPRSLDQLRRIAEALGALEGSEQWSRLLDLSREDQPDRLAPDVAEYAAKHRLVPLLMRTVANKKLDDKDLLELARKIEENY